LAILLAERSAAAGRPRENVDLKRLQRDAYSASPSGSCLSACRWSGGDADGDSFEWASLLRYGVGAPCTVDAADEQVARPVGKRKREEEHPAFDFCATIAVVEAALVGTARRAFAHPTRRATAPYCSPSPPPPYRHRPLHPCRGTSATSAPCLAPCRSASPHNPARPG
jgi:hypothetical protein